MITVGRHFGTDRLVDLERTVDSLNGQLREMQWELYRARRVVFSLVVAESGGSRRRQEFMSAVCSRRARPNTKMVSHADPRARTGIQSLAPVLTVGRWSSGELPVSMG